MTAYMLFALFLAGVCLLLLIITSRYFLLWLRAYFTGANIALSSLVMMSLRKVNPNVIVDCKVVAVQADLEEITTNEFEAQFLAGGDPQRVTLALVAAKQAGIDLDWNTAAAIDLAGRDIMEAVRVSVIPKVINCPASDNPGQVLYGVAQDGIQLKVRVRVTVRTNLAQLIGGATESTVIARIGQSVVSSIGSCASYRDALGNPLLISRQALKQGLDSQTAFTIVSVDIADIDVGKNIGAKLQIDQAEADIRIGRAKAEVRRAMAVARRQEMRTKVVAEQARLVLAESQVPSAIAQAFRTGRLHAVRQHKGNGQPTRMEHFTSVRTPSSFGKDV